VARAAHLRPLAAVGLTVLLVAGGLLILTPPPRFAADPVGGPLLNRAAPSLPSNSAPGAGDVPLVGSAMASLAHGAGPAGGQPWNCVDRAGSSFRCDGPAASLGAPSSARATTGRAATAAPGLPNWYDQTTYMDNGSSGPPSVESAAAYDPDLGEVVLYGGFDEPCAFYTCASNYTWEYNDSGWSDHTLTVRGYPPKLYSEDLVWDPQFDAIVMAGGVIEGYVDVNDTLYTELYPTNFTWEFQGNRWTNITAQVGPIGNGVGFASAAYDDARHELVLVGGCWVGNCSPGFNDYWALTPSTGWRDAGPAPALGIGAAWITAASMAYDRGNQTMVLFGGYLGSSLSNATWILNATGWWNVTSTAGTRICIFVCFTLYPDARDFASLTWDGQYGAMLLMGGANRSGTLNDSWFFSNGRWIPTAIFFPIPGPSVSAAAMPTNSSDIAPLLVGGECTFYFYCYNTSWVFEGAPRPSIYSAVQSPTALDQLNVSVGDIPGSGSGPVLRWALSDNDSHTVNGTAIDVNFTSNASAVLPLVFNRSAAVALTFAVTDYFGVTNSTTTNISVVVPLTAQPTALPGPTEPGVPVGFSAGAFGGTGAYSYVWNFGDGSPASTLAAPTHTFAAPGTYPAWVNVTDAIGGYANVSVPVVVLPTLGVSIAPSPSATDIGSPIGFAADVTHGSGTIASYAWSFGDTLTSTAAAPSHLYTATGSYLVSLNVTDSLGVVAGSTVQVAVHALPSGTVSSSDLAPTVGTSVTVTATPSDGTGPYSFAWTFGDGGTAAGSVASHAYAAAGTFEVTVVMTDADGHSVTRYLNETVSAAPPPPPSPSGSPFGGSALYLLVAAVVILLAVVAALLLLRRSRSPPAPPPPTGSPPVP